MAADTINSVFGVKGHVAVWRVDDRTGLKLPVFSQPNQIQYTWGYIAAKQIGYKRQADRADYHISAMYIEYENLANTANVISTPAFNRDIGIDYYNGLSSSTTKNYLRVPLSLEPALSVSSGYDGYLPVNQSGNQLTFFAQTAGANAVYPESARAFGVSSKVYAACLVATPDFSDRTKDVIFARTQFSGANQVTKEPSSQIGITWDIAFL